MPTDHKFGDYPSEAKPFIRRAQDGLKYYIRTASEGKNNINDLDNSVEMDEIIDNILHAAIITIEQRAVRKRTARR